MFRGWAELDGVEIANSSRVIEHVGAEVPTRDLGMFGGVADCSLALMRPNRVADPGMYDAAVWGGTARGGGAFNVGAQRIDFIGNNVANMYTNLVKSGPGNTTGDWESVTAPNEQWRFSIRVTAPLANPATRSVSIGGQVRDTTAVQSPTFIGTNFNVAPGESKVISAVATVPVGRDRIRPVFEGLVLPTGYTLYVSEPEVDRLLDASMPGLAAIPSSSIEVMPGLWSPPDGSRLWGPGLYMIGECWDTSNLCRNCRDVVDYDDSWPGLAAWLGDTIYRPEIAPWYSMRIPESAEFGGIWLMDVQGLDTLGVERNITEMVGDGGAAGPARTPSRAITFDAVLIACTNAGLTYGLEWLRSILRATNDRTDGTLRYLSAHPGHSTVDPDTLVREAHGVVLTEGPTIKEGFNPGNKRNQQATVYRVGWTLTATRPLSYSPPVSFPVVWDEIAVKPITWVHAANCRTPSDCADMPLMFSTECDLETIEIMTSPPPSCGGCLPICQVTERTFIVPTFDHPLRTPETVVTLDIANTGADPLTIQGFWRVCDSDARCDNDRWPIQVSGLPPASSLHLDGVTGRYWTVYDGRKHRPMGIVGTPNGVPWRPPVISRDTCWEFVVRSASGGTFDVRMSLADREG